MYGKIHDQIFGSSIMEEDIEIRYVWLCMIATADKEGFIDATIPALARKFNVPEKIMSKAIECFLAPDATSRTPTDDGKRIEPIRETFGWKIINYEKYRDMRTTDDRRNYMKDYMQKYRQGKDKRRSVKQKANVKVNVNMLANTDTDTYTYKDIHLFPLRNNTEYSLLPEKIEQYKRTYPNIDVSRELLTCKQWNIDNPSKRKTQSGILKHINLWLSKASKDKGYIATAIKQPHINELRKEDIKINPKHQERMAAINATLGRLKA